MAKASNYAVISVNRFNGRKCRFAICEQRQKSERARKVNKLCDVCCEGNQGKKNQTTVISSLFFFTSSSKRENDQQLDSAGNASDRVLLHQFKEEFLGGSNSLKTMLFSRHRRHSSPEKEVAPARDKKNEEMTKNSGPSVGLFCFFPSSQPKPV